MTPEKQFLDAVLFATVSYIVWSIAMLPHTLARIVLLLVEWNGTKLARL